MGRAQRLALAGGLALDAAVLLLDEPTSMLDAPRPRSCGPRSVAEVDRPARTLVVVEHQIEPWLDFADRLVVLDADGVIVADGQPRAVLAEQGRAACPSRCLGAGLGARPQPVALDASLVAPLHPGDGRRDLGDDVEVT